MSRWPKSPPNYDTIMAGQIKSKQKAIHILKARPEAAKPEVIYVTNYVDASRQITFKAKLCVIATKESGIWGIAKKIKVSEKSIQIKRK